MGSSRSRDNPVTETYTKAQGGQKDGSVAADHQAMALVREVSDTREILPEVSDDKQTLRP
jgi:hypothetical protein